MRLEAGDGGRDAQLVPISECGDDVGGESGAGRDIYAMRGIDRASGCLVLVRPDQYEANVLPLDALDEIGALFAAFMLPTGHEAALGKG